MLGAPDRGILNDSETEVAPDRPSPANDRRAPGSESESAGDDGGTSGIID